VSADPPVERGRGPSQWSWLTTALVGVAVLLGLALLTIPDDWSGGTPEGPSSPLPIDEEIPPPVLDRPHSRSDDRFRWRVDRDADGPLLGVPTGATMISTDFDGWITAVGLDAGSITRTEIRTGSFVTVGGTLVVQTGCGAWRMVDLPDFTLGDELIDCGSYKPIGQRGANVALFERTGSSGRSEILVASGDGEVTALGPTDVAPSAYGAVSAGRVLVEAAGDELVWIQAAGGEPTHYADGRLIASGPAGVLWTSCGTPSSCDVWFGTPDQSRVHRFAFFDHRTDELLARMNRTASRAVFFLPDGALRILSLETGYAREIENPGIRWATASWSPDGLWLLDPTGPEIIALNTLNGHTVRFDGVPGDVSPGWVAVIEDNP
jgi:hypothetical protein